MSPGEVAVHETFVVPRYLSLFGDLALKMLGEDPAAKVVHLHSRTGHPHQGISRKLLGARISGRRSGTPRLVLMRPLVQQIAELLKRPAEGYVRDAMDKYWSDGTFELTVNVGCVTGRKL